MGNTITLSDELLRYQGAVADTDRQRMYEGHSTRTGNQIYQNEVDAARSYIRLLEQQIADLQGNGISQYLKNRRTRGENYSR